MESFFTTGKGRHVTNMLLVFLAVLSLFLLFKFINEIKRSSYIGREYGVQNTVTVYGEGEVFAVPDIATFSFSVTDEKPDANEAQRIVTNTMNEILEALEDEGVDEKDIKTTSYNIYPRYDYRAINCITYPCPPGENVLRGYEVSHSIVVKVRDTDNTGDLLSLVGEMGADNVSGISFSIDDEDALREEAREIAIQDAKEKAGRLARDLGVRIVRVVSFYENSGPYYYEERAYTLDAAIGIGGGEAYPSPNLPTGENRVVSNVSITYEIR